MVQVLIEVRSGTVIVLRVSTSFLSVLIVLVILCFSNENMNKSFKTCTSMSINLSTDVRTDFSRTCVCDKVCVTVTSALFRIKSVAGYRTARRAGSSWSRLTLRRGDFLKEFSIWMRLRSVICIGKFVAVSISVHEDDADFLWSSQVDQWSLKNVRATSDVFLGDVATANLKLVGDKVSQDVEQWFGFCSMSNFLVWVMNPFATKVVSVSSVDWPTWYWPNALDRVINVVWWLFGSVWYLDAHTKLQIWVELTFTIFRNKMKNERTWMSCILVAERFVVFLWNDVAVTKLSAEYKWLVINKIIKHVNHSAINMSALFLGLLKNLCLCVRRMQIHLS